MKSALFAVVTLCALLSYAKPAPVLSDKTAEGHDVDLGVYIDEGSSIEITSYDAKENLYNVKNMAYPKTTWFRASPEDLAKSVPSVEFSELKRTPTSIVGEQFRTESDLRLTPPDEAVN